MSQKTQELQYGSARKRPPGPNATSANKVPLGPRAPGFGSVLNNPRLTRPPNPIYIAGSSNRPNGSQPQYQHTIESQFQQPSPSQYQQYQQPMGSQYQQPMGSQYQQPMRSQYQQPMGSQYQQPMGSQYQQAMGAQYEQPMGMEYASPMPGPMMRQMARDTPQQQIFHVSGMYQQQERGGRMGDGTDSSHMGMAASALEILGLQQTPSYDLPPQAGAGAPNMGARNSVPLSRNVATTPVDFGGDIRRTGSSPEKNIVARPSPKKSSGADIIDIEKYSKLVGWNRQSKAPDDVVIGLLNAIYDNVSEMKNLTSEKRIYELVKLLKEYLNLLLVPTYEFQKYFEQYLKRLIKDRNWISISTAQALCISVTAPDEEATPVNRKFFCNFCTLSYSSSLFTCETCSAPFRHIADFQAHEFQAHGIVRSHNFVCDFCQQNFPRSPLELRDHIYDRHICRRKHLECPFGCEKLILEMSEHSYNDHIKAHHQCSKCEDLVNGSMETHVKMFHNELRAAQHSAKSPPEESRKSGRETGVRSATSHRNQGRSADRNRDRDYARGRSSPPRSRMMSGSAGKDSYEDIMELDIQKAQETLREMQRAKELLGRGEQGQGQVFSYCEPQVKAKWPQCKTCKLQQPPGGFKCDKCSQLFPYRVYLFKHVKEVHRMVMPKSFECEMCAKVFSDLNILQYHVTKESHVCSSEHLQCTYGCMNLFQNKHSLDVHTNAKHEFMCHICEAPVVNQTKKKHFTLYHPGEKFPAPTEILPPEMKTTDIPSSSYTQPSQLPRTITLAPRITNHLRQSLLNLAAGRQDLFLTMPPPVLTEQSFASKSKTQLVNMGYIFCRACELVYHPALPVCRRCNNAPFLNSVSLAEHESEVHKITSSVAALLKECNIRTCGAKFMSYVQLINHQVEHYCRQHTECPFGCKELIIGSETEVVSHCRRVHPNKEIPKTLVDQSQSGAPIRSSSFVKLHKLHEELQKRADSSGGLAMEVEITLKCITCSATCSEDCMRVCDHCGPDNAFSCADNDELRGHLAEYHKLFIKGDFKCEICSSKRGNPVNFPDDPIRYLEHRQKFHATCTVHKRCPNAPCTALYDPKSVAGDKHLRMLCQYMKEMPQPNVSDGDIWKNIGWKNCIKCRYTVEISKIFVCSNCEDPKPFFTKDEYFAHLVVYHSYKAEYTFVCFQCKSQFGANAKSWLHHRQSMHKLCDQHLVCSEKDCAWMAPNKSEIERHLQADCCQDHEIKGIVQDTKICHVCSQIFSDGVIFQCLYCTRTKQQFMSLLEYLVHLENIHDRKVKGNFDCLECKSYSATTAYELSRHNYTVHKKCSSHKFCPNSAKCSVVFPSESLNMQHQCLYAPLKSIDSPSSKAAQGRNLQDRIGSSVAPLEQKVIRPVVLDDDEEALTHKCQECHFKVSDSEKEELNCSMCSESFVTKTDLCAHLKVKHSSIVRGKFECNLCSPQRIYDDEPDKLLDHFVSHHKFCRSHKQCPDCLALIPGKMKLDAHYRDCKKHRKHEDASPERKFGSKFFEGIGVGTTSAQPVKVVVKQDKPGTLIDISDDEDKTKLKKPEKEREKEGEDDARKSSFSLRKLSSFNKNGGLERSSSSKLSALKPSLSTEPLRLPDKYKMAKEGKTKLYVCRHCNYASLMPPPGKFKGDMKCRNRSCGLIFHQKFELVSHLELAHNKPLPPIKTKMICEFCRDQNVKPPFAHNESVPLCEHKKLAHGCCRTHICCPVDKCSLMFPTRDLLEQHQQSSKNCETLFVALDKQDEKPETWTNVASESLSQWKKKSSSAVSSEKSLACVSCDLKVDLKGQAYVGSYSCSSCEEQKTKGPSFLFRFELLAHMLRDHSLNKETQSRFVCDICNDNKSLTAVSLVAHRKTSHNFCKVHYRCSKGCLKLFNCESDVKDHEAKCDYKAAASEKERRSARSSKDLRAEKTQELVDKYGCKIDHAFQLYECSTCSRKFGCMNIFKCNMCPDDISTSSRSFVNLVEFFAHLNSVHKIETDIEHSCAVCDRFKATASEMQRHVRDSHRMCAHHFLCPKMCKYLFDDKEKLLQHYQQEQCTKPPPPPSPTVQGAVRIGEKRKEDGPSAYQEVSLNKKKAVEGLGSEKGDGGEREKKKEDKPKWEDMMANMLKYTDELFSDDEQRKDQKAQQSATAGVNNEGDHEQSGGSPAKEEREGDDGERVGENNDQGDGDRHGQDYLDEEEDEENEMEMKIDVDVEEDQHSEEEEEEVMEDDSESLPTTEDTVAQENEASYEAEEDPLRQTTGLVQETETEAPAEEDGQQNDQDELEIDAKTEDDCFTVESS